MAITREQYVTHSVKDYARRQLIDRGYPMDSIEMLDSFDDNMFGPEQPLDKQYIASGFDFDDDGKQAEMGSDLIRRLYTIEFWVLGTSSVWARNLAQAVKFGVEHDGVIPILDIADSDTAPDYPTIDYLTLVAASSNRVIVQDPAPWQKHIWVTRVRVEDEYFARLT